MNRKIDPNAKNHKKVLSYVVKLILYIPFCTLLAWLSFLLIAWLFGSLFSSDLLDFATSKPYAAILFGVVFGIIGAFATPANSDEKPKILG